MSRWRRDSEAPPPAHPADGLDAFDGGSTIDPYQGADAALDASAPADDDDQGDDEELDDDDEPPPDTERDASADALAAELRLEVLRETGPLRWQASCPVAFPCSVPEGEGPGECRYRLPAEPAFGCALAFSEAGPRTLGAVGEALGVGRARAGQLEARALRKFREALERVDAQAFGPDEQADDEGDDEHTPPRSSSSLGAPSAGEPAATPSTRTAEARPGARASLAELRRILSRHVAPRDIAASKPRVEAPQAPQAPQAPLAGDIARAVRAVRRAVEGMPGGRRRPC